MTDSTLEHGCERVGFVSCSPRGGTVTSDRIKCTGKGCLNANVIMLLHSTASAGQEGTQRLLALLHSSCRLDAFEPAPRRTLTQPLIH